MKNKKRKGLEFQRDKWDEVEDVGMLVSHIM